MEGFNINRRKKNVLVRFNKLEKYSQREAALAPKICDQNFKKLKGNC